jgi:L-threonylcarbamoyladenylate synthase
VIDAAAFERCVAGGGVVVFPADTVYGLACDPQDAAAVARLYAIKGRPPQKPAAVMFFALEAALRELAGDLGPRTRAALEALLPGALTLLLPNPRLRFPLACAGGRADVVGVRVPAWPPALAALAGISRPVMQSSANRSGGPDARRLADVPEEVRAAADLTIDGGELPGTPSTVLDLRAYEDRGDWAIVRLGAVSEERVAATLGAAVRPR